MLAARPFTWDFHDCFRATRFARTQFKSCIAAVKRRKTLSNACDAGSGWFWHESGTLIDDGEPQAPSGDLARDADRAVSVTLLEPVDDGVISQRQQHHRRYSDVASVDGNIDLVGQTVA